MHEYIPAIYIHSCARFRRKSFSVAMLTGPLPSLTLPSRPPGQAHDMVNVWQWRAIGNNHGNKKNRQDGCGDSVRRRFFLSAERELAVCVAGASEYLEDRPSTFAASTLRVPSLSIDLKRKGARAPNLSAAVGRIKSAGRLTSEVTTLASVANTEWSKTLKKGKNDLKH